MSETIPLRPYIGLMPFRERDAEFFYGRDQERNIITSNLMASRLTLLYGASGVGKSSVLRAGVAYHLRALARRDIKRRGRPKFGIVIFNSWSDDPLQGLLDHVSKAVNEMLGQQFEPLPTDLSFVDSLREWSKRAHGQLLIILDQFEEYFLYHPNEDGENTFAVEFPRAVNTLGLPVNFIVSYREDAHASLDFFKGRIATLYDNYLRIGHLDHESAYAAIEQPIRRYNELRNLDKDHEYSVPEELIRAVLSQVRAGEKYIGDVGEGVVATTDVDEEKNGKVETPYLQLVMERLWETEVANGSRVLQLQTLEDLGGAKRIVQTHLDNALGELSKKEQAMGAESFKYLVTPSGTKIAQTARDLAAYSKLTSKQQQQLEQMMKKLTSGDRRILRTVPPPNQRSAHRYEVFHDVLAQAILDWRRRYLARKQFRRLFAYLGAMAIALLVMGGVTTYAVRQRSAAVASEMEAIKQRRFAEEQTKLAVHASEKTNNQAQLAQAAKQSEFEQRERAEATAAENKKLATSNKELADRALAANNNLKTVIQALEVERQHAQTLAERARDEERKASAAAQQANEALNLIYQIDRSNAYSKAVIRPGNDLLNIKAAINKNGTRVATFGAVERDAQIWNVKDYSRPTLTHTLIAPDSIDSITFGPPDSNLVVTVSHLFESSGKATIWDISGTEPTKLDELLVAGEDGRPTLVTRAEFNDAGDTLTAYGTKRASVCGWNRQLRKLDANCKSWKLTLREGNTVFRELSADGKLSVYSFNGTDFYVYDSDADHEIKLELPNFGSLGPFKLSDVLKVTISPDNKYVAVFYIDNVARVFNSTTGAFTPFSSGTNLVSTVAFSRDSKLVVAGTTDGVAGIWEINGRERINLMASTASPLAHTAAITDAQFSPDNKYLVTASGDRTARVWDVVNERPFVELRGHYDEVRSASFSADGNLILTVGNDETTRVWDLGVRFAASVPVKTGAIENNGQFDFDEGLKSTTNVVPDVSWSFSASNLGRQIPGPESKSITVALRPENNAQLARLIVGETTGSDRNFDDITLTELLGLNYTSVAIGATYIPGREQNPLSPGSRFAVRTSDGNYAKVEVVRSAPSLEIKWSTYKNPNPFSGETTRPLKSWSGSELSKYQIGPLIRAGFSRDGSSIAIAGPGNKIKIVETSSGNIKAQQSANGEVTLVKFSPDGRVLTGTRTGQIIISDAATGKLIIRLMSSNDIIHDAAFSNKGRLVAIAGEDNLLRIYDATSGRLRIGPLNNEKDIKTVAFSPDDNVVLTGSDDDILRIWDTATGALLHRLSAHSANIVKVAFSPDSKYFASLDESGSLRLWRLSSVGDKWQSVVNEIRAYDFAFNPVSRSLAIAGLDGRAHLSSLSSGLITDTLENIGPTGVPGRGISFSRDGEMVLINTKAAVWVWKPTIDPLESLLLRQRAISLSRDTGPILNATFSADNKYVFTLGEDGTVRSWELFTSK